MAEVTLMFSVTTVGAGITSSILGGLLADRFGPKNPLNYSRIAIAGSVLAWPAFLASVLYTDNIWVPIACTNFYFLVGECSWPANVTMMQRANPPDKFTSTVSVYQFFNVVGGCAATASIGLLIN